MSESPLSLLPNFGEFSYQIARRRRESRLFAPWNKLEEAERRLAFCRWLGIDNERPGSGAQGTEALNAQLWLKDSVSAFLLSYEAVLQFLKEMYDRTGRSESFGHWLRAQPPYDIVMRGVRTLRHLEAHVEPVPPLESITLVLHPPESEGGARKVEIAGIRWILHHIDQVLWERLDRPALALSELDEWDRIAGTLPPSAVLERALRRLAETLDAADMVIT